MITLPNIPRDVRYEKVITGIIIFILLTYSFFSNLVTVDKYTISLIGLLILMAVLPSVSSAKLPYILEVKRSLKDAKGEVESLDKKSLGKLYKTLSELNEVQSKALKDQYTTKKEAEEIFDLTSDLLNQIKKYQKS